MYIRGKLLFANFIFNGYGTSAKDLQKQTVKTIKRSVIDRVRGEGEINRKNT